MLYFSIIKLIFMTLIICAIPYISCELFTALAHMERMINVEDVLLTNLKNYVSTQREKLNVLKSQLIEYEVKHLETSNGNSILNYLSNPINAFLTTKRLTKNFDDIEIIMKSGKGDENIANITKFRKEFEFPTEIDLKGTALALLRIQKTYDISISRIANGEYFDNEKYRFNLTSDDCFLLGKYYTEIEAVDYKDVTLWLLEALSRLPEKNSTSKKVEIYRKIIESAQEQKNLIDELYYINQILKLASDDEDLLSRKQSLIDEIKNIPPKPIVNESTAIQRIKKSNFIKPVDYYDSVQKKQYEKLCRKEIEPTPKQLAPLRCRYITNNIPFLKIAPIKMEELHLDPEIYLYHDVIYETEINILQDIAMILMETARVYNMFTGKLETTLTRTSKSVFLSDHLLKWIKKVSIRAADITGLNISTAEELQVVNYGIGGHYDPHVDFFPDSYQDVNGNRIATVLFYMSDVTKGGGTAFPFLNTVVWPKKGAAAFWYNLYQSGEGDLRTKHAGCPILAGTKWVANKWFHSRDQEFLRPCGLKQDGFETNEKYTSDNVDNIIDT